MGRSGEAKNLPPVVAPSWATLWRRSCWQPRACRKSWSRLLTTTGRDAGTRTPEALLQKLHELRRLLAGCVLFVLRLLRLNAESPACRVPVPAAEPVSRPLLCEGLPPL